VDKVTLLTLDSDDSFSTKKARAVFVLLTAVYDPAWRTSPASYCDFYLTGTWSA